MLAMEAWQIINLMWVRLFGSFKPTLWKSPFLVHKLWVFILMSSFFGDGGQGHIGIEGLLRDLGYILFPLLLQWFLFHVLNPTFYEYVSDGFMKIVFQTIKAEAGWGWLWSTGDCRARPTNPVAVAQLTKTVRLSDAPWIHPADPVTHSKVISPTQISWIS